ncbi:type II secretion system F family protein [Candidatus Gracilibacteria bacterium]|nr:type II secretion system F family protein [Candidatus Gracilibacteria bacterium]
MIENKQAQNTENLETLILDISNEAISIEQKQKKKIISINSIFNSINDWIIDLSTVPLQEKLLFFQLLGAMVNAGLPILECLTLLHDQTKHAKMKIVIKEIKTLIESGESLAQAMRANDDVFDDATCSVIEAGEKSGKLNEILKELVDQYEQLNSLSKKMKAAMTYPVVVITVMILLTIVILVFVVPKLEELFGGAANLPLPTRILIGTSDFVLNQSFLFLSFIIASVASFLTWKKSKVGKKQWGRFLLVIPLVGDILQKMILTRISRIFGFLMTSGVPIVESLKIASHIAENDLYQEKLLLAADDLTKGISIAENLSDDEDLFPKMLVNMMAIGEKTASLDTVMSKAADFYKDELERKIEALSKIMEPIILAFIAFGAVFMILAIYLPILKMNDQILT